MQKIKILFVILFGFLIFSCNSVKEPIAIWEAPSGSKYKILEIVDFYTPQDGNKYYYIKFYSEDISDKDTLYKKFFDIYQCVALKNINLDGYTHVALEAIPIMLPKFGVVEYEVHRHNVPLKNITDLKEHLKTKGIKSLSLTNE